VVLHNIFTFNPAWQNLQFLQLTSSRDMPQQLVRKWSNSLFIELLFLDKVFGQQDAVKLIVERIVIVVQLSWPLNPEFARMAWPLVWIIAGDA
jgi:hypothetical protein